MNQFSIHNNFLVVSDYNWLNSNLEESWVCKATSNYIIYDRSHRFEPSDKIIHQNNVGQNIYDIFDFIITHYDNLPEVTIFCRAAFLFPKDTGSPRFDEEGNKLSNGNCTEEFFIENCNNKTFTELHDFFKEDWRFSGFDNKRGENGEYYELNNNWYFGLQPSKYYTSISDFFNDMYVDPPHEEYIRFSPGGCYIIPKDLILKYNKLFYERIREILSWSVLNAEAHMIERALTTIFIGNYEPKTEYKNTNKMTPIHLRNIPPPAETFNHTEFFDTLFKWIRPENYLELGVRHGGNFVTLSKHCKKAIGVDMIPAEFPLEPNMEYHQTTTDNYFNNLDDKQFDVVFIDADHSHEQSMKDFLNVKDRVIEDGFIFFHDTYPWDWSMTDRGQCEDVYKTALFIKQNFIDEFEIITLPINPGVTLCKKISRKKQMIYDR
jgi:hypothetical protein